MLYIDDIEQLNQMKSSGALFILFGGEHCTVCQSLRPQLSAALGLAFAEMTVVYVDCEKSAEICAQHRVFSLPVVQAYIDGQKIAEEARVFSIKQLIETIQRPYAMWKSVLDN